MSTTLPVPSADPSDLLFNAAKLDEVINSSAPEYVDRLGVARLTAAGAMARYAALNPRGAWTTATLYAPRDLVLESGTWYIALDSHTSGATFAGDLAAHWRPEQGVTAADLANIASELLGAGLVRASQSRTYTAGTLGARYNEVVSVRDDPYFAVGDGVTDDTSAIQDALDSGAKYVEFPAGYTFLVRDASDTLAGIVLDCPSNITLSGGGTIKLGAHTTQAHRILQLNGVSNVDIRGIKLDGNRVQQTGASDEQSHGVFMTGSTHVRIQDCEVKNMMGDGIYVGGSANPGTQNVLIEGNTFDNNFRQCISIVRGQYIRVIGNHLSGTTGSNPGAGVDLEANTSGDTLRQITISGNHIRGNYFGIFCNELAPAREITITGNTFSDQRNADIYCRGQHVVIANNVIYPVGKTVASAAIEISLANGVQVVGNTILGNYDSNERGGVRVTRGCKNVVISNNLIRKTLLTGIRLYLLDAIGTGNTSCITVMGNVLEDCLSNSSTSAPILLGAVSGTSDLTQVVLKGNIVTDTRSGGLEPDYGIQYVNMTDAMLATVFVEGNIILGPTLQSNSVTGWEFIAGQIVGRVALDFDLTAVTSQTLTATVQGAVIGDVVALGVPNASAAAEVIYTAWVSAANTVSVRALRVAGTPNPASGTFNISVTKLLGH